MTEAGAALIVGSDACVDELDCGEENHRSRSRHHAGLGFRSMLILSLTDQLLRRHESTL